MNTVSLIGNLATDVDLKQLSAEKRVASFVLAVDRQSKDGGADFVRIAAWDKQAELCERYLSKGKRVAVDGRLRSGVFVAVPNTLVTKCPSKYTPKN